MAPNSANTMDEDASEESIFKILVATDIHLGFSEKDAKLCKFTSCSFITLFHK